MNHSLKQGVMAVVLVALLGFAAVRGSGGSLSGVWRRLTGRAASPPVAFDESEILSRYGFRLQESARECGIDFHHESDMLDGQLAHIMPLVTPMGAAAAVIDFDGDGWLDIYTVTSSEGGKNALYRNRGDGTFEDVAEKVGLADVNQPGTGTSMGSAWADYLCIGQPPGVKFFYDPRLGEGDYCLAAGAERRGIMCCSVSDCA